MVFSVPLFNFVFKKLTCVVFLLLKFSENMKECIVCIVTRIVTRITPMIPSINTSIKTGLRREVRPVTAAYPLLPEGGHLAGQLQFVLGVLVLDEPLLHLSQQAVLQLQMHVLLLLQSSLQAVQLRLVLAVQLHTHTRTRTHARTHTCMHARTGGWLGRGE